MHTRLGLTPPTGQRRRRRRLLLESQVNGPSWSVCVRCRTHDALRLQGSTRVVSSFTTTSAGAVLLIC
ncbi:hypothetical protein GN956_G25380 [Arapaima gigas]